MFGRTSAFVVSMLLLSHCYLTAAQLPFPRQCPDVKVPKEFNLDAYMGVWYEFTKYPFIFEIGKKCMQAHYANAGNNTVAVLNSAINRLTGANTSTSGTAKVLAPSKLAVVFNINQSFNSPNYIVLGTDYKTYAVVYSCTNLTTYAHTKLLWILTRERKPSAETIAAARKVLDDNQLSSSFLIDTIQEGCEPASVPSTGGTHIALNTSFSISTNKQPDNESENDSEKEYPAEVIDLNTISTDTSNVIDRA